MEGIVGPPQLGYGYSYAVLGHIGALRNKALRCKEVIDVKENLNFTVGYSKSVYTIKQGAEQIKYERGAGSYRDPFKATRRNNSISH